MTATRGFVRTPQSSRARLSHFPTDDGVLRVEHPQTQLVLIWVLVCRDYRIPFSDCSPFDLKIATDPTDIRTVIRLLDCTRLRPVDRCRTTVSLLRPLPEYAFCQYSVFRIHIAWAGASTMN